MFDAVALDGPSPSFRETREAFAKQTFRLKTRPVAAGLVDAKIEGNNQIVIRTENVKRFSIWLHPSMIEFSKPVLVSVNGKKREFDIEGQLLTALRSYQRRHDWGLIYHAEIMLACDELLRSAGQVRARSKINK